MKKYEEEWLLTADEYPYKIVDSSMSGIVFHLYRGMGESSIFRLYRTVTRVFVLWYVCIVKKS